MNSPEEIKNRGETTGTVESAGEMRLHPVDEVRKQLKGVRAIHESNLTQPLHDNLKGTGVTLTGDQTPIAHEGIVDHSQFEKPNTGETRTWANAQERRIKEQEELERAA